MGALHSRHRSPFTCVDMQKCINCLDELPTLFNNNNFLAQRKTLPIIFFRLVAEMGVVKMGVDVVEVDSRGIPAQQSLPASIIICY